MRSYLRISPQLSEEKEADGYKPAAIAAYVALLCEAEKQSPRGRFRNLAVLRAHLGTHARWVKFMLEQLDLELLPDGRYYVTGWDEWQEGDWQVKERMQRVRAAQENRNARNTPDRNENSVATVTTPSRVEAVSISGEHLALSGERSPSAATVTAVSKTATNGADAAARFRGIAAQALPTKGDS